MLTGCGDSKPSFDQYRKHALPAITQTQELTREITDAAEIGEYTTSRICKEQADRLPDIKSRVLTDVPDKALENILRAAYSSLGRSLQACEDGYFNAAAVFLSDFDDSIRLATARINKLTGKEEL